LDGVLEVDEGMTRLLELTEGVMKGVWAAGVCSDEGAPDGVLSLLRERLDDVGEGGICTAAMVSGSVLVRPPLSFALRLRARSLCSVKKRLVLLGSASASGGGRGCTRKLGGGLRAGASALLCRVWRRAHEVGVR
jgi:hypothetical protein